MNAILKPVATLPLAQAGVTAVITDAGAAAEKRFVEFFAAQIRNPNTRGACFRACTRFLDWLRDARASNWAS